MPDNKRKVNMLQLQRNVPPPPKVRRLRPDDARKKYPIEGMQIDDFFFVPHKRYSSIRTYFSTLGRQHGVKLKADQIYARQGDAGWEQCPEDAPGAVSGVGVWRIA